MLDRAQKGRKRRGSGSQPAEEDDPSLMYQDFFSDGVEDADAAGPHGDEAADGEMAEDDAGDPLALTEPTPQVPPEISAYSTPPPPPWSALLTGCPGLRLLLIPFKDTVAVKKKARQAG